MDIAFVILNYNIIQETLDCIHSIRHNIDTKKYSIIIVDNASPNQAGKYFQKFFKDDHNVIVIENKENLGFARGNNIGIKRARTLEPEFICCLNNDVLLEQKDFYKNLQNLYFTYHAAVIGPQIHLKDNSIFLYNQKLLSIHEYEMQREKYLRKLQTSNKMTSLLKNTKPIYRFIHRIREKRVTGKRLYEIPIIDQLDVVLHGCCLIFTKDFFEACDGLHEGTFLYREEEILFVSLKKKGLHSCYSPKIQIKHLEDVSTKSINLKQSEADKMYLKNQVQSLSILINELKDNKL